MKSVFHAGADNVVATEDKSVQQNSTDDDDGDKREHTEAVFEPRMPVKKLGSFDVLHKAYCTTKGRLHKDKNLDLWYNTSMADYLTIKRKRRSGGGAVSGIIYIVMNIAVAVSAVLVTAVTGTWVFGLLIALVSKWRVFSMSPRHWWANIKANLVDFTVRISFVMLAYMVTYFVGIDVQVEHLVITALFVIWLLFVKPRTSAIATEVQALISVFLGTMAAVWGAILMLDAGVSFEICMMVVVGAGFLVGYGGLRHIVAQSEDYAFSLPTLAWGIVSAEVMWLMFHKAILYYVGGLVVPQAAVIMTLVSFAFYRLYRSAIRHGGRVDMREVIGPVAFAVAAVLVILIWFSSQRLSY